MKKATKEALWRMRGDYLEGCVAAPVCPAYLLSPLPAGYCQACMTFHITQGYYDTTDLGGLTTVIGFHVPGEYFHKLIGQLPAMVYIDDRADKTQEKSLELIWKSTWIGPVQKVKKVPITYEKKLVGNGPADQFTVDIPGIYHHEAEPMLDPTGQWTKLQNGPLFGGTIYLNISKVNRYNDPDFPYRWDVTGTSSTYFEFVCTPGGIPHPIR